MSTTVLYVVRKLKATLVAFSPAKAGIQEGSNLPFCVIVFLQENGLPAEGSRSLAFYLGKTRAVPIEAKLFY
ncbi:MAG: hypothetical protein OXM55_02465 [Bdellovibrionales bacterium]|nr:hypothetical protein [Bdellovibrionales bacterium]